VKWHAGDVARALSAAYWDLPREVIGAHYLLLQACAAAENSGVWRDSASWDQRQWLRFTGLEKAEVDGLVDNGLARWLTRDETEAVLADVTPSLDQVANAEDKEVLRERCRLTADAVDRCTSSIDRRGVSIAIDEARRSDRSRIDLLVIDFDLGGQVLAQFTSEVNRKNVQARWNRQKQLDLLRPPGEPQRTSSIGSIADRHSAGDTAVIQSESKRNGDPPQPPLRGGRFSVDPSREEQAQLEGFWAWFLRVRPLLLNSALWGGGKQAAMKALAAKAADRRLTVAELLEVVKGDLERKFRDAKWVNDWALSGRGFRSYVRDDDWESTLPPPVRAPQAAPLEDKGAVADRNLVALLRDPDVPPERKEVAKQRWLEHHPGAPPPWERHN
jgi:hypothetical protein